MKTSCTDIREHLQDFADQALETEDSARVIEHLKTCESCRTEFNEISRLHQMLDTCCYISGKPGTAVHPGVQTRKRRPFLNAAALILAAVGLVLVASPLLHQNRQSSIPGQSDPAAEVRKTDEFIRTCESGLNEFIHSLKTTSQMMENVVLPQTTDSKENPENEIQHDIHVLKTNLIHYLKGVRYDTVS